MAPCNESQVCSVKIKLNDLSPQHLLMDFNGSRCCHRGYLTTRKSKHNYRCEGQ